MSRNREQVPRLKFQKKTDASSGRVVLVGTYKGDQLSRWRGWYCWPLDREKSRAKKSSRGDAETQRNGAEEGKHTDLLTSNDVRENVSRVSEEQDRVLKSVTELWLFRGTAAQRNYRAEFVGIKTREELIRDYGYPAQGKPHGDKYLLFKPAQEVA